MTDDAYTDFAVHFETCPRCRRDWTCETGVEIQRRESQPTFPLATEERP